MQNDRGKCTVTPKRADCGVDGLHIIRFLFSGYGKIPERASEKFGIRQQLRYWLGPQRMANVFDDHTIVLRMNELCGPISNRPFPITVQNSKAKLCPSMRYRRTVFKFYSVMSRA